MNITIEQLTTPKVTPLHLPELNGDVYIRTITQGEASAISDRYDDPDGEDAEQAGRDIVHASLCNENGEPLLESPDQVKDLSLPVLQKILNAVGLGEDRARGN